MRCIHAFHARRAGCRPTGALGMAVLYRVLEGTGLQEALWMGRVMVFDEAADWNYGGSTCSKNAFECMFLPVTRHMRLLPYQHGPLSTQSTGRAYVLVPVHTLRPPALSCALLCSALRQPACNMQQATMRRSTCSVQRHATRRYSARASSRSASAAAALPARSAASAPSQTLPWCAACASHVAQYRGRGAGRNSSAKALTAPRCAERRCRTGMCVWPRL